jgi:hypothetical protein
VLRAQRVIPRPWFLALFVQAELLEKEELVLQVSTEFWATAVV